MEENVFNEMAKRYDSDERKKLAKVIVNELRSELQDCRSKSLIDYGSGTGLVSLEVTDLVDSLLLVDSSKQMLEIAEAKISQQGWTNAKVRHADFTKEAPDLKADIVMMSLVLLHIPDTKKILQAIYQVLNRGGTLLIIDFDKNENVSHPKVHNGFSHEELKQQLADVGFSQTEVTTFYQGERIFMNQDASLFLSTSVK